MKKRFLSIVFLVCFFLSLSFIYATECNHNNICEISFEPCACEDCWGQQANCETGFICENGDCVSSGVNKNPVIIGECAPGETQSCYTGPTYTNNVGICHAGIQICNEQGEWDVCSSQQVPIVEICNDNLDNDCDNLIDCSDIDDCVSNTNCLITPIIPSVTLQAQVDEDNVVLTWNDVLANYNPSGLSGAVVFNVKDYNKNKITGDVIKENIFTKIVNFFKSLFTKKAVGFVGVQKSYGIYMSVNGMNYALIATVLQNECNNGECSYMDTGLAGGTYYYKIISVYETQESEPSNIVSLVISGLGQVTQQCSDNDNDGYGTDAQTKMYCTYLQLDCNDINININPGTNENCSNNLDDDCDGLTDCADTDCSENPICEGLFPYFCDVGTTVPCITGLHGVCSTGTQTCNNQGQWGSCIANIQPSSQTENCDNDLDDDCDGLTDCDDNYCNNFPICQTLLPTPQNLVSNIQVDGTHLIWDNVLWEEQEPTITQITGGAIKNVFTNVGNFFKNLFSKGVRGINIGIFSEGYKVYRSNGINENYQQIFSGSLTSFSCEEHCSYIDSTISAEPGIYFYMVSYFKDNEGSSYSNEDYIIIPNQNFVVEINANSLSGNAPLTVQFNANVIPHYGGIPNDLKYEWKIGDEILDEQSISYTFNEPNTYEVFLGVISDTQGFIGGDNEIINVLGVGTIPLQSCDCATNYPCPDNYKCNTLINCEHTAETIGMGEGGICELEGGNVISYQLLVNESDYGVVTSYPVGINCGIDCNENYNADTIVTLTAVPLEGYGFFEWSEACGEVSIEEPNCTLIMDNNKSVSVLFVNISSGIGESLGAGSGGGGGGSSGGSSGGSAYLGGEGSLSCTENWTCSLWVPDSCLEGTTQTRVCQDLNDCGTEVNIPSESRLCPGEDRSEGIQDVSGGPSYDDYRKIGYWIYLIWGIILLILIGVLLKFLILKPKDKIESSKSSFYTFDKNTELINFVKDATSKGYKEEELRKLLRNNGWPDEYINNAFDSIKKK